MGNIGIRTFIFMQFSIIVYSFSGVFQKLAAQYTMMSFNFLLFYGLSVLVLVFYAVLWQLILKKVPLTTAYSNRALSIIWSLVWGCLFFSETITWNKVVGAIIICVGISFIVRSNNNDER
ncbi:MAG: EamA family transporter [Lachnospiraceae bacterium]|nr:EamA family transporter [Lachnospiraceae bacterium]